MPLLLSTRGHLWSLLSLTIHPASASLAVLPAPFCPVMRGCLCSCERVPAGTGLSAATDPWAPGPFWIGFLSRLLSRQVTQDALELDVQTYPTISLTEALHKFLCPETRIPPLFLLLIGLLLLQSFIELSFLTEAVSILVFITHPVLDYHVVAIQFYYSSTNITLIHRVGLQPG